MKPNQVNKLKLALNYVYKSTAFNIDGYDCEDLYAENSAVDMLMYRIKHLEELLGEKKKKAAKNKAKKLAKEIAKHMPENNCCPKEPYRDWQSELPDWYF